jgi:hypothetical protein
MYMLRTQSCLLLILSFVIGCGSTPPPVEAPVAPKLDFSSFTSSAGKFSIDLPGAPKYDTKKITIGKYETRQEQYHVDVPEEFFFVVRYYDVPEILLLDMSADQLYEAMIEFLVEDYPDKSIAENKALTVVKFPGRQIEVEVPKKLVIVNRLVLIGRRLFIISIKTPASKTDRAMIERYLDSFQYHP